MILPKKLKEFIERYLEELNRSRENGGYLYGTDTMFKAMLPVPNYSDSPRSSYSRGNTQKIAEEFGRALGYEPIAAFHTHPDGKIPSSKDLDFVRDSDFKYEVVVCDQDNEWDWICIDKDNQRVPLSVSDEDLDPIFENFTETLGLRNIGRVTLTPRGELLCQTDLGEALLEVDEDALKLYKFQKNCDKREYSITQNYVMEETGLSRTRLKKANEKLKKYGLNKWDL